MGPLILVFAFLALFAIPALGEISCYKCDGIEACKNSTARVQCYTEAARCATWRERIRGQGESTDKPVNRRDCLYERNKKECEIDEDDVRCICKINLCNKPEKKVVDNGPLINTKRIMDDLFGNAVHLTTHNAPPEPEPIPEPVPEPESEPEEPAPAPAEEPVTPPPEATPPAPEAAQPPTVAEAPPPTPPADATEPVPENPTLALPPQEPETVQAPAANPDITVEGTAPSDLGIPGIPKVPKIKKSKNRNHTVANIYEH